MQGTNWFFTWNNFTDEDVERIKALYPDDAKYIRLSYEIAPTTGKLHIHFVISFTKNRRINNLKKMFPGVNLKIVYEMTGILEYIQKYEDVRNFELGNQNVSSNGDSALEQAVAIIRSSGISDVVTKFPTLYIMRHSGLERYATAIQSPRSTIPQVSWIYGPPGSGKTWYAFDKHRTLPKWMAPLSLTYWNGYENQPVIIFDDFRRDLIRFHELLKVLQEYPMTVNTKNGYRHLNSPYIFITCPYSPWELYDTTENIDQLISRLTNIIFKPTRYHNIVIYNPKNISRYI